MTIIAIIIIMIIIIMIVIIMLKKVGSSTILVQGLDAGVHNLGTWIVFLWWMGKNEGIDKL